MKINFMKHCFKPIITAFMMLLMMMQLDDLHAQDRDGSIDLTAAEGRGIFVNHDGSGSGLGVENRSFSVEGWVHLITNGNNNFNFFRFRSGDSRVSLHYRGDDNKSDGPWKIEVKGTGYGETSWELDYNKNIGSVPDLLNSWHHVAFTYNGSSTVKLYIDGVERFGWTLVSGGSGISALFPSDGDGDGDCLFGSEAYNSDSEGKYYLAEARIWKTQLSSSEISTYYDEEVNQSHPHWTDLIRYYQGHQTAGTGSARTFEDVSPVNEYDATVSNSDVIRSTDYTPIIKPGSFNNSKVSADFTAGTCEDSEITITWDNFQNDTEYRSYTTPRYEVKRSRDGKVIYSGNAADPDGIWRDTDVSPGDSETYTLRTFWYIDDIAYYSDDEITSNAGNLKEEFASPTGFDASDANCDGTIDLSWDALTPAPPYWQVERATLSNFDDASTLTSTLDGKVTTYEDGGADPEQTYYYRVIARGNDDNGCSINASYSVGNSGLTSNKPTAPTNFTIAVDEARNEIDLSWTNPGNSLADGYLIIRQKSNGTDRTEIQINDANTTTYSDNGLEVCETYEYSIAAYN
ncbi:MAG: LamG-like jellyroll fold domain-containing protein, partial [Bacteroidota bacterium]